MKNIGIPGWVMDNKYFGITVPYAEFIRKHGNLIVLNPDEPARDDLDLLVLPGGLDVSPHKHKNSKLSLYTGNSNPMLEYFDNKILPNYIDKKQSILGICRGAQMLWSYFGGLINQHMPYHTQSDYNTDECHELQYLPKYSDLDKKTLSVNSRHHQTMVAGNDKSISMVPDDLEVVAIALEEYGKIKVPRFDIVEIFRHTELPIWGYQWHPEDCPNDNLTEEVIKELFGKNKQ